MVGIFQINTIKYTLEPRKGRERDCIMLTPRKGFRLNVLRIVGLLLIVALLLTSGAFASTTRAQAAAGTLRVGWTAPTKLDPALFADGPDISIGVAIYDYLITLDQKSALVPSLAKEWKVSADGKEYTITLQSGVKFHDGSDFTSEDVKFTFERLMDEKVGSGARGLYTGIASITAVDPTTVKFTLKEPSAIFLATLADYHAAILKKGTTDPATAMNGTGPFTKVSVDLTSRAEFAANPNYWRKGEPKVAKLEMTFVKDTRDLIPALRGGQLDFVARLPIESFNELKADANLTTGSLATNQFSLVRIRADRKPGSDVKVRQALRLAIDRDAINKAVFDGLALPGNDSPVGPLYGDLIDATVVAPKRDVAAAKKLLEEAGFKDGLSLKFIVPAGEQNADELAQVLQAQWKEAGINVEITQIEQNVYYGDDKSDNFWLNADLAVTLWASRPDPQLYLDVAFKTGAQWNEAHWSDPDLDKLIDSARAETDGKKRAATMSQIQKIFVERGPAYIPYFQPLLYAHSKKVSGINVSPDPGLTSFATAVVAQ
jgi:peptide/nickel transport system substrate-binding protein